MWGWRSWQVLGDVAEARVSEHMSSADLVGRAERRSLNRGGARKAGIPAQLGFVAYCISVQCTIRGPWPPDPSTWSARASAGARGARTTSPLIGQPAHAPTALFDAQPRGLTASTAICPSMDDAFISRASRPGSTKSAPTLSNGRRSADTYANPFQTSSTHRSVLAAGPPEATATRTAAGKLAEAGGREIDSIPPPARDVRAVW